MRLLARTKNIKQTRFNWQASHLTSLLNTVNHLQLVNIYLPGPGITFKSVIMGFDFDTDEMLIDTNIRRPHTEQGVLRVNDKIWVQSKIDNAWLNFHCQIVQTTESFTCVRILDINQSENRRWNTRVYLPSYTGPSAELYVHNAAAISGVVGNLSVRGCLIECYGKDQRKKLSDQKKLLCKIRFNSQFVLDLRSNILQCRYLRKPCSHNQLRLYFCDLTVVESEQLGAFIDSLAQTTSAA